MKHATTFILAGVLAGLLGHAAWFSVRRPQHPEGLEAQMHWMQARLDLSDDQYTQIRRLHEDLRPKLAALARQVVEMRGRLAAFEHQRVAGGQIDFVEFARFVRQQQSLSEACLESTQNLVDTTASFMTPRQRARYLAMLAPVLANAESTAFY